MPAVPEVSPGRFLFLQTEKWPLGCQGKKPQLAMLHVTQRLAVNKQKQLPQDHSPFKGITGGDGALSLVIGGDEGMQGSGTWNLN